MGWGGVGWGEVVRVKVVHSLARMQHDASCITSGAHGVLPIIGWPLALARGSEGVHSAQDLSALGCPQPCETPLQERSQPP